MRRRNATPLLLAIGLAVCAQPALAQAWAGRGRAQGVVEDEAGNPIEGAEVTLRMGEEEDGPEPAFTDEKGRWLAAGLAGGNWTAVIEKEGFIGAQGPVYVTEFGAAQALEVTLQASPYAAIDVGDQLLEAGKPAEARAEYEKALEGLEPEPAARLRARIGDTHMVEGNYAAAREQYQQALPHIPAEEQAYVVLQLAASYDKEGNYAASRAELEKAIPLLPPPDQGKVLLMMARSHDAQGDRANAIATLERALELEPEDPELLTLIADLLAREGRDVEAEQYLARLPQGADVPPDMLLNQGIRHYNENETEQALAAFDRLVQQDPGMADAYYYRGLTYLAMQRNDEARADFEKHLELAPDGAHAAESRDFLSYLQQNR